VHHTVQVGNLKEKAGIAKLITAVFISLILFGCGNDHGSTGGIRHGETSLISKGEMIK